MYWLKLEGITPGSVSQMLAGKIVRLRQRLMNVADSVKGFFGSQKQQDNAAERLERLQARRPQPPNTCLVPSPQSPGFCQWSAMFLVHPLPGDPDACPGCAWQARMEEARALFRDPATTEFVIVTIPTVMAAAESSRLAKALRAESVPVNTILINQV